MREDNELVAADLAGKVKPIESLNGVWKLSFIDDGWQVFGPDYRWGVDVSFAEGCRIIGENDISAYRDLIEAENRAEKRREWDAHATGSTAGSYHEPRVA